MEYKLNKGVGQDVEFCGLKAQYLYLFAGGLLAVFLVFVILYMAGVNRLFCIALCVMSATGITLGVFRLNRKYGPHGLMKLAAAGYRPYYIINRKRITSLLNEENMRNILKASTLESKFPLLAVEDGCILSKDADVTVGFKVRLPEVFTLTSDDYEAMHGA